MTVQGHTTAEFAPLRAAFEDCFALGQHGGSVAVVHRGVLVAELWGGFADAAGQRAWQQDTLVNVWSCTKGIAAVAMACWSIVAWSITISRWRAIGPSLRRAARAI